MLDDIQIRLSAAVPEFWPDHTLYDVVTAIAPTVRAIAAEAREQALREVVESACQTPSSQDDDDISKIFDQIKESIEATLNGHDLCLVAVILGAVMAEVEASCPDQVEEFRRVVFSARDFGVERFSRVILAKPETPDAP